MNALQSSLVQMTPARAVVPLLMLLVLLVLLVPLAAPAEELGDQLWAAARKGDVAAVKALLAKGVDVNTKFRYDTTALWWAAFKGHAEVVRILLAHGADVNVKEASFGGTPLGLAAFQGSAEIVSVLLDKGAEGADTALEWAAMRGHLETVKLLLNDLLKRPGLKPETLSAALAAAAKGGHTGIAELLKKAGAKTLAEVQFRVDPETLKKYAGSYKSQDGMEFNFTVKEAKLTGGNIFDDPVSWEPVSETVFQTFGFAKATIAFNLEGEKVVGFRLQQMRGEFAFRKVER